MKFRYAHLADLHLGSWREPLMRELSTRTFLTAIDDCIARNVDFILFAGDLFNTSLPSLDTLKIVTAKLKELSSRNIPLYVIAGSHDFSPSGKTMLDVLEKAGLLVNVCKGFVHPETKELHLHFTIDQKTNAKMTGILGRKGLLDRTYYENLHRESLEQEPGYKIFLFHTTLTELKPKHLDMIESQPASFLPKHFNYYAGGHIHHPTQVNLPEYGPLTYTGALFPNNFAEVEKYSHGGYYFINVEEEQQGIAWIPVKIMNHQPIRIDCNQKSPDVISFEILNSASNQDLTNTIVTIRLEGKLSYGKLSDINFTKILEQFSIKGVYCVLKNTSKIEVEGYEEIKTSFHNPETMEDEIIKEHLQQMKLFDATTESQLIHTLLTTLNTTKREGETITDFQKRIESDMNKLLQL